MYRLFIDHINLSCNHLVHYLSVILLVGSPLFSSVLFSAVLVSAILVLPCHARTKSKIAVIGLKSSRLTKGDISHLNEKIVRKLGKFKGHTLKLIASDCPQAGAQCAIKRGVAQDAHFVFVGMIQAENDQHTLTLRAFDVRRKTLISEQKIQGSSVDDFAYFSDSIKQLASAVRSEIRRHSLNAIRLTNVKEILVRYQPPNAEKNHPKKRRKKQRKERIIEQKNWHGDSTGYQPKKSVRDLNQTNPLEARFFRDLRDGNTEQWGIDDVFFIISGVRTIADLDRARAWIDQISHQADLAIGAHPKAKKRAKFLLKWLHKNVFRSYNEKAIDGLDILRNGQFSGLSSCILYALIAQRLNVEVRGVVHGDLIFCRVYKEDRSKSWEVHTSHAKGFKPRTRWTSTLRSKKAKPRELAIHEMIALIYPQRIALKLAYPEVRDRLLAYQKAELLSPNDPIIQHNIRAILRIMMQAALKSLNFEAGLACINIIRDYEPESSLWSELLADLFNRALAQAQTPEKIKELGEKTEELTATYPELSTHLWTYGMGRLLLRRARFILKESERAGVDAFSEALAWTQEALNDPPADSRLLNYGRIQALQYNYDSDYKNLIIETVRSSNQSLSTELIEIALEYFPNDTELKRYLRLVQRDDNSPINRSIRYRKYLDASKVSDSPLPLRRSQKKRFKNDLKSSKSLLKDGDYFGAEQTLKVMINAFGQRTEPLLLLGEVYMEQSKYNQAITTFYQAAISNPFKCEAWTQLGKAEFKNKLTADAKHSWTIASERCKGGAKKKVKKYLKRLSKK